MEQQQRLHTALDRLVRRSQSADAEVAARARVSLDATEVEAVKLIGGFGALAMRDFSNRMRIPASTATSVVDRLERKAIVARERNAADRRVVQLSLTAAGKAVLQDITDEHLRLCREMLAAFSPGEQDVLLDMIQRLSNGAKVGEEE